jgi:hypothetical protein
VAAVLRETTNSRAVPPSRTAKAVAVVWSERTTVQRVAMVAGSPVVLVAALAAALVGR